MSTTVNRSDLSTLHMVAGNEDLYTRVVDPEDNRLKAWVGTSWVDEGMATDEHRLLYPTIKDD
jgi:hypothetical protein